MRTTALAAALVLLAPAAASALSKEECVELLKTIDHHQRNTGDYKALAYMEQKERDKADVVYEAVIYRRDADEKLMILFLKPKAEQGKGYLRIDKNLWMYDPSVGKWERRTERERIGGTGSRRRDFDESRLAEEYEPTYVGEEKLGAFTVHHLKLTAKEGIDVAYPVMELWVDKATTNVLKSQEYALSGRLMRTSYTPKWQKVYSESKKAEVYFPAEMRFYDEVDKANSTLVLLKSVDLRPLDANLFTKAWLESKSR
ncbi:MAG: outer membrane lipoprotein-sorting protein [Deltaproteobacteria bacterium]|nr:outer membrane lipoprotein-sorting protein [Deltaproteobacteria bacterium]